MGDGVAVVVIVEEPAIKTGGGDGSLESLEVHKKDDTP